MAAILSKGDDWKHHDADVTCRYTNDSNCLAFENKEFIFQTRIPT